jgi:hypothetical protein
LAGSANLAATMLEHRLPGRPLRQINSQMNPLRLIVYAEWSGKAFVPVSAQ